MRIYSPCVRCIVVLALLFGCALSPSSRAQPAAKETKPLLAIRGVADKAVTLSAEELDKLPHQSVTVVDKGGESVAYAGVPVAEILKRAGLDFAANLHGRALTRYLLVEAADKYRIVFSLPEIDPAFTDHLVLLATARDGKPLSSEEGPWRIIVPDEKRQARWVRQVRLLTIMDAVGPSERNKKP